MKVFRAYYQFKGDHWYDFLSTSQKEAEKNAVQEIIKAYEQFDEGMTIDNINIQRVGEIRHQGEIASFFSRLK